MTAKRVLAILRGGSLTVLVVALAWISALPRTASATPMILYVKSSAAGANNGTSWANAYTSLQTALDTAAGGGYEIWVAAGTYRPFRSFPVTNPADTFQLHNGVALYGGFAGAETQRSQRNWQTNVTTLSGYWFILGNPHYAYHVVTGSGTNAAAVLDGFTVSGGKANGDLWDAYGGGMINVGGSPTVSNVIFNGNSALLNGGGMVNALTSNSTLTNVTFTGNSATRGGGIFIGQSNPALANLTFIGNSATSDGGGMYNFADSPAITNVTFSGNWAVNYGGAMYNGSSGNPIVSNVTLSGNSANNGGGGVYNDSSNPSIVNSILWGNSAPSGAQISGAGSNPTITYSDIQGGYAGTGNINSDPKFIRNPSPGSDGTWGTADDDYGDLHLQPGSPAIDAGSNAAVPGGITTDRDGNPRIMGKAVDMGAYETFFRLLLPSIWK